MVNRGRIASEDSYKESGERAVVEKAVVEESRTNAKSGRIELNRTGKVFLN